MWGFYKKVEVYSTLNMEYFFRAKDLLASNHIAFKDTSTNNQLRLAFNSRGTNVALSRDGAVKTNYSLSVHKKDEYKARQVLGTVPR